MSVDSTYAIVVMIQQVYNTEIVFFDLDKKHNLNRKTKEI